MPNNTAEQAKVTIIANASPTILQIKPAFCKVPLKLFFAAHTARMIPTIPRMIPTNESTHVSERIIESAPQTRDAVARFLPWALTSWLLYILGL